MISQRATFSEPAFIQNKDGPVQPRSRICCAWSHTNPACCLLGYYLCWVSSHLLWYQGEFHHFPRLHLPPLPFQHSHQWFIWVAGKEWVSLQNFRGPKEANLVCYFCHLEFPSEERNQGRKCKRPRIITSECLLAPVLIYTVNTEQITKTFEVSIHPSR